MRPTRSNARWLAEERMRELSAMPLEAILELIDHPTERAVSARTGESFRIRTQAFWDKEPFESELFVRADIRGRGLHALDRFTGIDVRDPDTDFVPSEYSVRSTWSEKLAWVVLVLAFVVPLAVVVVIAKYVAFSV